MMAVKFIPGVVVITEKDRQEREKGRKMYGWKADT